jgi:hypothetical protein
MIIETTVLFFSAEAIKTDCLVIYCRGAKALLIHTGYGIFVFCAVVVLMVVAALLADDADRHSREARL